MENVFLTQKGIYNINEHYGNRHFSSFNEIKLLYNQPELSECPCPIILYLGISRT
jgi:hypothetical protein